MNNRQLQIAEFFGVLRVKRGCLNGMPGLDRLVASTFILIARIFTLKSAILATICRYISGHSQSGWVVGDPVSVRAYP